MPVRKIFCTCHKYLGEIRDATLHKSIFFLCSECNTKRIASDLAEKTRVMGGRGMDIGDLFKDMGLTKDK